MLIRLIIIIITTTIIIIIIIITIIRNCLEDGIGKYWQLYAAVLRIALAH